MRKSILNRSILAIAAGALTITLAACGEDAGDDSNPGDESTQIDDMDDDDDQDDY